MDIAVLGIVLGKTVCSLAGVGSSGAIVLRRRIQRFRLLEFLAQLPPCVVAMEACGGAHHVGRFSLQFGHEPRLMSPLYVRPYVKVHKNDDRDAEGIAEAATRPTMSFVPIKTEEQLDLQALHRARERLVQDRTRLINQARGFLMERGIRPASGRHVFQKFLTRLPEDHAGDLTPRMMAMLADMAAELATINEKGAALDREIKSVAAADDDTRRLMEIPGVGPTIATALVAAVGDGKAFRKGRDLAAWLGLVPRQVTTGGRATLIGISKHGNTYLRKLFIHGARAVLHLVKDRSTPLARWVDGLKARTHANVAAVAMANKIARIALAVLTTGERYLSDRQRRSIKVSDGVDAPRRHRSARVASVEAPLGRGASTPSLTDKDIVQIPGCRAFPDDRQVQGKTRIGSIGMRVKSHREALQHQPSKWSIGV